jgi:hypothetical protein
MKKDGTGERPLSPKLSSFALQKKLKKLPPSAHDETTLQELERFRKIGGVGWKYLGDKLWEYKNLPKKLNQIEKILEEFNINPKRKLDKVYNYKIDNQK